MFLFFMAATDRGEPEHAGAHAEHDVDTWLARLLQEILIGKESDKSSSSSKSPSSSTSLSSIKQANANRSS